MAYNSSNSPYLQGGFDMSGAGQVIQGANFITDTYVHFEAEVSPTTSFLSIAGAYIEQGTIVYLGRGNIVNGENDLGKFIPGLPDPTSVKFTMPLMVVYQNQDATTSSTNVNWDKTTTSHYYKWAGMSCAKITTIPLCAGYELGSSFYDTTKIYAPGTLLTAIRYDSSKTDVENAQDVGKLTTGTLGTDQIVGIVSRGVEEGSWKKKQLCFWGTVIPASYN